MDYQHSTVAELSSQQWHDILKLRSDAFVVEQSCVYPDPDLEDLNATHHTLSDDGKLMAYGRSYLTSIWHLGRIVVHNQHRGEGLGKGLVKRMIEFCEQKDPSFDIVMSAQVYLSDYYQSLGFDIEGSMYLEDGIPHVQMRRKSG